MARLCGSPVGDADPFQFLASWIAPEERYKSPYNNAQEAVPIKPEVARLVSGPAPCIRTASRTRWDEFLPRHLDRNE